MSSSTTNITKGAYLKWLCEIKDELDVTYNSEGTHVIHAYCCCSHCIPNLTLTRKSSARVPVWVQNLQNRSDYKNVLFQTHN